LPHAHLPGPYTWHCFSLSTAHLILFAYLFACYAPRLLPSYALPMPAHITTATAHFTFLLPQPRALLPVHLLCVNNARHHPSPVVPFFALFYTTALARVCAATHRFMCRCAAGAHTTAFTERTASRHHLSDGSRTIAGYILTTRSISTVAYSSSWLRGSHSRRIAGVLDDFAVPPAGGLVIFICVHL